MSKNSTLEVFVYIFKLFSWLILARNNSLLAVKSVKYFLLRYAIDICNATTRNYSIYGNKDTQLNFTICVAKNDLS